MKLLLVALIAIGIGLIRCAEKKVSLPPLHKSSDTTHVLAVYLGYQLKGILYGPASKIVEDSVFNFKFNEDSTVAEKEWTTITKYIVEVPIPVKDSLTAATLGIKNWTKDTVVYKNLWADQKHVREPVLNWDSAVAYLNKFRDTTNKVSEKPRNP